MTRARTVLALALPLVWPPPPGPPTPGRKACRATSGRSWCRRRIPSRPRRWRSAGSSTSTRASRRTARSPAPRATTRAKGFADAKTGLRGHRRPEGHAQRADRPERDLLRVPVLGRPRREPRGAGQGADHQPGRDGRWRATTTSVEGRARDRPSTPPVFKAAFGRDGHDRRRGGGDRELRAHASSPSTRRSTASWPATRPRCRSRRSAAGCSSTARRAATPATRFGGATPIFTDDRFHNIGVAAQGPRLRRARAPGRAGERPAEARVPRRLQRARPLPRHQAAQGHRRLQDARGCATSRSPRPTCTTAARRRCWT